MRLAHLIWESTQRPPTASWPHIAEAEADAVGVDQAVVSRRTEELCNLDKCPKSIKVIASYEEAEADAVGLPRTVIEGRAAELTNLDKCPKSSKVTATYAEAEADWKPPLYTVWAFSKSSNDIEHAGQSEWWMGEMLAVKDPAYKAGSGRGKKGGSATLPPFTPPSLDDLSISKRESAEAQRLAKLPKNPGGKGTPKNCLSKEKELEAHEKAARLTGASPASTPRPCPPTIPHGDYVASCGPGHAGDRKATHPIRTQHAGRT